MTKSTTYIVVATKKWLNYEKGLLGVVRGGVAGFEHFTQTDILNYCTIMHDDRIQITFSTLVKNILDKYREITEESGYIPPQDIQTRYGRNKQGLLRTCDELQ